MDDHTRPRRIVKLAAKHSKSAAEWLERDERGIWEKLAAELWERTIALNPASSDAQLEDLVAASICIVALDAMATFYKNKALDHATH